MAKNKLSLRIANAVRALRGEPWPAAIEPPRITYRYLNTQTIGAMTSCPLAAIGRQGTEVVDAEARLILAKRIGVELLDKGAIEITKRVDSYTGWANYYGRVRVAMPGTYDGYRAYFFGVDELHNMEKEG